MYCQVIKRTLDSIEDAEEVRIVVDVVKKLAKELKLPVPSS
ncbi:hypothetical protein [Thermococcus sp. LS2]|nr:hypothetical protein [Thermococcus sp. LS2]